MNFSRVSSSVALAAGATLLVTTLAACGSDSESVASSTSTSTTTPADPFSVTETQTPTAAPTPAAATTCPTAAPAVGGTPEWTLPGATGSVSVTGSTDTTAPDIKVETPFSVTETQVQTLQPGDGPVVADTATVSVCYMGVNGRDGSVFDSSYQRGAPEEFPLNGVVPGFQKAIAGQKVGSTVAVAMTSADGYADGQPAAGILPGDTLVFAIKILDASS
ncbi:FKBP-type peptidyl-prolyl cis-trans isomerase [Mycobacterium barrassiae]|uniref:FKBP-type peptidyl-prolyl cis-trans isomerase n=1 Tax=Mycobacterium barrassiae TaxID=319709 RepID=UPI002265A1E3|nr:FKBP-type peptidyl-prolyl cis-trans isomerase [Mycobacterium barrassiae]MCV7302987.1 FKBP-type peptidyl-prolyl cis-trans isomerase [Mycobacterium barrassiae]